jgi:hypothetical protein
VTTLLLAAVLGTRVETSVALAADLLLAVVLTSKGLERGLNDTTTKAENEVKGGLFLDVVVSQSAAVFELLASEDQTLLIRGDALLVLDLGLDSLNGVRGVNIQSDNLVLFLRES